MVAQAALERPERLAARPLDAPRRRASVLPVGVPADDTPAACPDAEAWLVALAAMAADAGHRWVFLAAVAADQLAEVLPDAQRHRARDAEQPGD